MNRTSRRDRELRESLGTASRLGSPNLLQLVRTVYLSRYGTCSARADIDVLPTPGE